MNSFPSFTIFWNRYRLASKEPEETIQIVNQGLDKITDEQLNDNFPMKIWENETGMAYTIIHLHSHLNYHLGQINYHRRILDTTK